MFNTPEEMETKIKEYFDYCDAGEDAETVNKRGEVVKYRRQIPYTMEGLALHLDCADSTLRNYAQRDEFLAVITRARSKIYDCWIKRGLTNEYNAKIVALCLSAHNHEYRANQQHELTVKTTEDRLREIHARRQALEITDNNPSALPDPRADDQVIDTEAR